MPNTPTYQLPYPTLADPPNGPDGFQKLATATDTALLGNRAFAPYTSTTRPAHRAGLAIFETDTGVVMVSDGTTWWESSRQVVPGGFLFRTADYSCPAAANTILPFQAKAEETIAGICDVANNKLICKVPGIYLLELYIPWSAESTGTFRQGVISVNGATVVANRAFHGGANLAAYSITTGMFRLALNDYIEAKTQHNASVNVTISGGATIKTNNVHLGMQRIAP